MLTVAVALSLGLAGCAKKPAGVGDLAKDQTLRFNVGAEPETLDPALQTGIPEFNIGSQMYEGLTRMDGNNKPYAGVAEKWDISSDNLKYTFHLRKNAKWSNGDPVTAKDFEWSWKRALDPRTGSQYAYQLYYIKGGKTLNEVDAKDEAKIKQLSDALGVKATDDYTLEVTLEAPTPYFLGLTSFPTLYPVHRAEVEKFADKWATKPEQFVTNGPFKMTKWVNNQVIEMEKSKTYWDAKNVPLKKLMIYLIDDQNTGLTMWESGQTDLDNNVPVQEIDRLKKEGKLTTLPYLGTYYYSFNVTKKPFDDPRVRKAFAMAIDRKLITDQILKDGRLPAYAFVCPGIPDTEAGKDFRAVGGDYFKEDIEAAKKLLADAGYKDMKKFPSFEIIYNSSASHKAIAEAIQEMWSKNLGIPKEKVKLHVEEWKVYLETRDAHNFQVARAGWIGDYVDPMTFMDMFVTNGGNNDTTYSNPKFDELINTAKMSADPKVRMQAMHDAEKILIGDDMVVAPIYYYVSNWLMKPYVKGLAINTIGGVDFKNAWIEKH